MRLSLLLFLFLCGAFAKPSHSAVLKDHASATNLFDGQSFVTQDFSIPSPETSMGLTAAFTGDGEILKTVGAVFAHEDAFGNVNGGSPGGLEFRLSFFESQADYVADPFLENPTLPNVFHRFQGVSNLGTWLMPVGQSDVGHDYFYWEFDVEFLGIETTSGAEHLISIIPEADFQSGPAFMAVSDGGIGAIGQELDWITSRPAGISPTTFKSLDVGFDFGTYRIVTVPEPSAFSIFLVFTICLLHAGKGSYKPLD